MSLGPTLPAGEYCDFHASRFSITYPVMGNPPSALLGCQATVADVLFALEILIGPSGGDGASIYRKKCTLYDYIII